MRTVLFHRDFGGFTGGHLKVWDYFHHTATAPGHAARVFFSPRSLWDQTNPWLARRDAVLPRWEPARADVLFLAGTDWLSLPAAGRSHWPRPVVNLIQHVRHADPADGLSGFLSHRAVRVCVSGPVRDALAATGRVNGPLLVIPDAVDPAGLPVAPPAGGGRPVGLLICGLKQSALARALAAALGPTLPDGGRVKTLLAPQPRADFLESLAGARRALFLPHATEGFYLPALEAMFLETLVLCPDCVGNRTFCRDGGTALVPATYDLPGLLATVARALALDPAGETRLLANAHAHARAEHTLAAERAAFHRLLACLDDLW